jgi:hypothetical protein
MYQSTGTKLRNISVQQSSSYYSFKSCLHNVLYTPFVLVDLFVPFSSGAEPPRSGFEPFCIGAGPFCSDFVSSRFDVEPFSSNVEPFCSNVEPFCPYLVPLRSDAEPFSSGLLLPRYFWAGN